MEDDISTLCCEVISVDDDNDPAPDNFMQSYDVFPTPSSPTIDVEPQLGFRRQLIWYIVYNILNEETGAGRVYGKYLRTSRGALGDHNLVTAPKYCGK